MWRPWRSTASMMARLNSSSEMSSSGPDSAGTGLFGQIFLDLGLFLNFDWFGGGDLAVPDQNLDRLADLAGETVNSSTEDFESAVGVASFLKSQRVAAVGVGIDDELLFEIEVHVLGLVVDEGQVVGLGAKEAGLEGGQLLERICSVGVTGQYTPWRSVSSVLTNSWTSLKRLMRVSE